MTSISSHTVLEALTKARLAEIGRSFSVDLSLGATKDALIITLTGAPRFELPELLGLLLRDELKSACRAHGLDDAGRARGELASRLLQAWKPGATLPPPPRSPRVRDLTAPVAGDIVHVRHRQYLVEEVVPPPRAREHTLARLVCLDDDAQGRRLDVLWELELGARVLTLEAHGLGAVARIDPPRTFAAYLHALKWSSVTATDAKLFQAPFRAGIKLMNHQLTPLKKALELPRANLFIADDVGLGKTIEAGLVLQELLLRARVDWALIVCPAAVALQWQGEMEKRFGLAFEIYNRPFVARRRQQRGFGVNPWATHTRFIISYQTLRRPEYRDPLLQHLGERARKSLLILDEAHTAAPASASKYAIDSRVTRVIRDVAPRFENRLFLSATPHNGHSNSFSALLEILDPQRFTRGVPVSNPRQLERSMVRRLKSDLRDLGVQAPDRKVVQIDLRHEAGIWEERVATGDDVSAPALLGHGAAPELELSRMLAEYTRLMRPAKGPGRLVFINLQKRLLSSIEAFHRTLQLHADHMGKQAAKVSAADVDLALPIDEDAEEYGIDDDALEEAAGAEVRLASRGLPSAAGRARELLDGMLDLAAQYRSQPDAKVLALLAWIRRNQCPGVRLGGAREKLSPGDARWTDARVILFTEYGDTKRYLQQLLGAAVEGTERGDERIMTFHGGMSDEKREEVQTAFNGPPNEHPVRILIATDAAREGVNLQGHCADLFHVDVPWNPGRMEQRNGRIDRLLGPPEVRCMYFFYAQRAEDDVLRTLLHKVERIQKELGSLGAVVMDRLADALEAGIDAATGERLERAEKVDEDTRAVARAELESQRAKQRLKEEIDASGRILNSSRKVMNFERALLRDALDVGFALAGAGKIAAEPRIKDGKGHLDPFKLPPLPESWQGTLDTLRPPRGRDEALWEWRKKPPLSVVFEPPETMSNKVAQLHLAHPLVQRVLARFLAQGYSAHDLGRVTIVRSPDDAIERVIAFGRLSLFGPGATRLHDELVAVAAQRLEAEGKGHLQPFADADDRRALERLEQLLAAAPDLEAIPAGTRDERRARAGADFTTLWPHIEAEAESREHEARQKLATRAAIESDALRAILEEQRAAIEKTLHKQLAFQFGDAEKEQREQYEQDRKHMASRLAAIGKEIETEPVQIAETYRVVLSRLEPVGMVYLWPGTR
jgi:ERCC4-related helicase